LPPEAPPRTWIGQIREVIIIRHGQIATRIELGIELRLIGHVRVHGYNASPAFSRRQTE